MLILPNRDYSGSFAPMEGGELDQVEHGTLRFHFHHADCLDLALSSIRMNRYAIKAKQT